MYIWVCSETRIKSLAASHFKVPHWGSTAGSNENIGGGACERPFRRPHIPVLLRFGRRLLWKTTSAFHRRMMEDIEALREHSAGISRLESQIESAPPKELLTLERELSQLQSETRSLEQYVHQSLQLTASAYQMLAQKIKKLSERLELTVVEDGVLSPEDMALGKALIRKLAQYQTRLLFASSDCRLNFLQHRTEYVPHGNTNQGIGESNPNIPRWRNYFKHTWRQCVQKVEQAEEGMKKHQGINRREDWTHFLNRVEATRTLSEEATRRGASKTGGTPDGDTYNWFSPTPSK
jgi:hypothetical protein